MKTIARPLVLFCLLLGNLSFPASQAAQIIFADGDFTGWIAVTTVGPGNGQTEVRQTTGGNPDAFLSVTTVTNSQTFTGHFLPTFVYDPAGGAIEFIETSIDYRNIASFGQGHGVFTLLLEQAGSYYADGSFLSGSTNFDWQSQAPVTSFAGSFSRLAGTGTLDFSVNGAPITVGFSTGNEGGNGINVGYDNFRAVINASEVPVPAVAWLLAPAFGLMTPWARRRSARRFRRQ